MNQVSSVVGALASAVSEIVLVLGVLACALIVFACICRVNLMHYGRSKPGWIALYILYAPFAGGMLIDLLTWPAKVDWWSCFGIAGILLHLVLTRNHWALGAPIYTEIKA